jgi:hypothetical protein
MSRRTEMAMTYRGKLTKPIRYYFAYGSNLNKEHMATRCPAAVAVAPLYLKFGRLVFRGVADVSLTGKKRHVIAGGLWRITRACEVALDRYEGVGGGLYRKIYIRLEVDGREEDCLLYKMNSRGIMPPGEGYLEVVAAGYRDFGLDLAYLDEALQHSYGEKNKTEAERRRRRRMTGSLARTDHLHLTSARDEGAGGGQIPARPHGD